MKKLYQYTNVKIKDGDWCVWCGVVRHVTHTTRERSDNTIISAQFAQVYETWLFPHKYSFRPNACICMTDDRYTLALFDMQSVKDLKENIFNVQTPP